MKKSLAIFLAIISISILTLEFFFDLKKEFLLLNIVLFLNWILIIFFMVNIIKKVYQNKLQLFKLLKNEKTELIYFALICTVLLNPRLAGALIIIRLSVSAFMRGLESKIGLSLISSLNLKPSQTMALSFIAAITSTAILLTFPAATTDGKGARLLDAIFTMTSAVCVTGLTVYDIGKDFTRFGQAIVLIGIQIGGLGIMVLSASFAVLIGGNIHSRRQVGLREVLDVSTPEGLRKLIRAITTSTIALEFFGMCCLFLFWSADFGQYSERLWWSVFHSISAFCNAGFGLASDSLSKFVDDPLICFVIMFLITSGGIGFFVFSDLTDKEIWVVKKPKAVWERLAIQTRVALLATIFLNSLGMLLFLFFEYDGALNGLSLGSKVLASLFQTVTLRTAGFFTVPLGDLAAPTIVFTVVFMFIGAAPGSTGGGIKTTTAAVSLMALRTMLRGRQEVEIMGRTIPHSTVNRSLSIVLISGILLAVFLTLLLATQNIKFEKLVFESVSAFATVGLTMDATMLLNDVGKILIILLMYVGRIGPLTLALAIGERRLKEGYHLPIGKIAVG